MRESIKYLGIVTVKCFKTKKTVTENLSFEFFFLNIKYKISNITKHDISNSKWDINNHEDFTLVKTENYCCLKQFVESTAYDLRQ